MHNMYLMLLTCSRWLMLLQRNDGKSTFDKEMVKILFNFFDEVTTITEMHECMLYFAVHNSAENASIDKRSTGYA